MGTASNTASGYSRKPDWVSRTRSPLAQLAKKPGAVVVRLAVAPAGCSGFRYRVDLADTLGENDVVFRYGGLRVAVDRASLPFIQGTTVRLSSEGLARRLRFDNPNARQSCGCGESFAT